MIFELLLCVAVGLVSTSIIPRPDFECPVPPPGFTACVVLCSGDDECRDGQICCQHGCTIGCFDPCPRIECEELCEFGNIVVDSCRTCDCKPNPCDPSPCPNRIDFACVVENEEAVCNLCPVVDACFPDCKSGFRPDADGCVRCACIDKCENNDDCEEGTKCEVVDDEVTCVPCPEIQCTEVCEFGRVDCTTCECKPNPCDVRPSPCANLGVFACLVENGEAVCNLCPVTDACFPDCKSGFRPDADGCVRCACIDKCENNDACEEGTRCEVVDDEVTCVPKKCPQGSPLLNKRKKEVTCRVRGDLSDTCPQGYWCNAAPPERFCVCCPED